MFINQIVFQRGFLVDRHIFPGKSFCKRTILEGKKIILTLFWLHECSLKGSDIILCVECAIKAEGTWCHAVVRLMEGVQSEEAVMT